MWWGSPTLQVRAGSLGLLPGDQVVAYSANVTIGNPSIFKDASSAILALSDRFGTLGYNARISNLDVGYLTASFKVYLSKPGKKPFSAGDAKAAIYAATIAQSFNVKTIAENAFEVVKFQAEILPTAASEKGRQQTAAAFQAGVDKTKEAVDAGFGKLWESIPTSVKIIGGAALGLYVLTQAATISRVFRGAA